MTLQDLIIQSTGYIKVNPKTVWRIMTGQQTQHRKLVKNSKVNPYRVGEIYWIKMPGQDVKLARIFVRITRAWREPVQNISEQDARAEGCDGFDDDFTGGKSGYQEFSELFDSIYPGAWDRNEDVWACEFELLEVTE